MTTSHYCDNVFNDFSSETDDDHGVDDNDADEDDDDARLLQKIILIMPMITYSKC